MRQERCHHGSRTRGHHRRVPLRRPGPPHRQDRPQCIGNGRYSVGPGAEKESGLRFHLFGPAHVPVMWDRCCCRITTLVWNMARMLKRHGQEVVLYGSAGSEAPYDEFVEIVGLGQKR